MSSLRQFLQTRRDELMGLIQPIRDEIALQQERLSELEAELVEVEKSAEAIGMVNGVQRATRRRQNVREGTIKDFAVQVLSDSPNGLPAADILMRINERFGTDYTRPSLSPQLSRLKKDGIIDLRGVKWFEVVPVSETGA